MSKKGKAPITQKAVSKLQSYADKNPKSSTATTGLVKRMQKTLAKKTNS